MTERAIAAISDSDFAHVTDGPSAAAAIADLIHAISGAATRAEAGEMIGLAGLDGTIEKLCGKVASLPAGARGSCKLPMLALIDEFDRLARVMRAELERVGGQIKGVSDQRRAAAAYGKPKTGPVSGGGAR